MRKVLVFLTLLFLVATPANALWCGRDRKLIREGDSKFGVIIKCGEPAYSEVVNPYGCEKCEKKEEVLYYQQGNTLYVLIFYGGFLKEIKEEKDY